MYLIRQIWIFKVRDTIDDACWTILAAINADRIDSIYDSYIKISIKESTGIARAKEKPIEIINLILDSPLPPEIKKFGHRPSIKSFFKYFQEITSFWKERKMKRVLYLVVTSVCLYSSSVCNDVLDILEGTDQQWFCVVNVMLGVSVNFVHPRI